MEQFLDNNLLDSQISKHLHLSANQEIPVRTVVDSPLISLRSVGRTLLCKHEEIHKIHVVNIRIRVMMHLARNLCESGVLSQ